MPSSIVLQRSFENLVAAFDAYLYSLYRRRDPQRGLIIFDKSNYEQQLQELSHVFKREGHQRGKLRNFAEVPLFLDSKASRLIQMADIVAYWIFRYFQSGDDRGYSLIKPFCRNRSSDPATGLIIEISAETAARLANIQPHPHPFPRPSDLTYAADPISAALVAAATPAARAPDRCRCPAHLRVRSPRAAALR